MPKLTIVKSDSDWYLIERAEHDGREWLQPTKYGASFMRSARFGNADVEGSASEMLAIADAIDRRSYLGFKRCAVNFKDGKAFFYSPRNSMDDGEPSTLQEADELAAKIRELIATEKSNPTT